MYQWQHVYRGTRDYISHWCPNIDKGIISVTAGLIHIQGNVRPSWSITATISTISSRRRKDVEVGGCLHDDIIKFWPWMVKLIPLHLSDDLGRPMHTKENGLYWLGFGPWSELNFEFAAKHFRVTVKEAKAIREAISSGSGYDPEAFEGALTTMYPRWKRESEEAIQLIKHHNAQKGV